MSDFRQNIESKRFLEVVDHLIDKQKVKNDRDLCMHLAYSPQSMSQIRKQKRDVTVELISKLFSKFRGNPIFVLSGNGSYTYEEPLPLANESNFAYGLNHDPKDYRALLEQLIKQNTHLSKLLEGYTQQAEMSVKYTRLLETQIAEQKKRINELETERGSRAKSS